MSAAPRWLVTYLTDDKHDWWAEMPIQAETRLAAIIKAYRILSKSKWGRIIKVKLESNQVDNTGLT